MEQPSLPVAGDLVVWPVDEDTGFYHVSTYPKVAFAALRGKAEAFALARHLALTAQLDAWFTDDGEAFQPLAAHRMAATSKRVQSEPSCPA